jgi:hypothetical protein
MLRGLSILIIREGRRWIWLCLLILKKKEKFLKFAEKFFSVVRVYADKGFVHCDVGSKREW